MKNFFERIVEGTSIEGAKPKSVIIKKQSKLFANCVNEEVEK